MSDTGQSSQENGGNYCVNCGASLESSMNFCPECGSSTEYTSSAESETGFDDTDREALEQRISVALENGWELEDDLGDHAVVVRHSFGSVGIHLLIGVFTIWWTLGLGNVLYAVYSYFGNVEQQVLRPDGASPVVGGETGLAESSSPSIKRLFVVGIIWLFSFSFITNLTVLSTGFGVLLFVIGAAMVPSIRARFQERDPITTNGVTTSVDERRVTECDQLCVVCREPIEAGVERTRHEAFTLLGISMFVTDSGKNHYCQDCLTPDYGFDSALDSTSEAGESHQH